jgi:hypothetical protein
MTSTTLLEEARRMLGVPADGGMRLADGATRIFPDCPVAALPDSLSLVPTDSFGPAAQSELGASRVAHLRTEVVGASSSPLSVVSTQLSAVHAGVAIGSPARRVTMGGSAGSPLQRAPSLLRLQGPAAVAAWQQQQQHRGGHHRSSLSGNVITQIKGAVPSPVLNAPPGTTVTAPVSPRVPRVDSTRRLLQLHTATASPVAGSPSLLSRPATGDDAGIKAAVHMSPSTPPPPPPAPASLPSPPPLHSYPALPIAPPQDAVHLTRVSPAVASGVCAAVYNAAPHALLRLWHALGVTCLTVASSSSGGSSLPRPLLRVPALPLTVAVGIFTRTAAAAMRRLLRDLGQESPVTVAAVAALSDAAVIRLLTSVAYPQAASDASPDSAPGVAAAPAVLAVDFGGACSALVSIADLLCAVTDFPAGRVPPLLRPQRLVHAAHVLFLECLRTTTAMLPVRPDSRVTSWLVSSASGSRTIAATGHVELSSASPESSGALVDIPVARTDARCVADWTVGILLAPTGLIDDLGILALAYALPPPPHAPSSASRPHAAAVLSSPTLSFHRAITLAVDVGLLRALRLPLHVWLAAFVSASEAETVAASKATRVPGAPSSESAEVPPELTHLLHAVISAAVPGHAISVGGPSDATGAGSGSGWVHMLTRALLGAALSCFVDTLRELALAPAVAAAARQLQLRGQSKAASDAAPISSSTPISLSLILGALVRCPDTLGALAVALRSACEGAGCSRLAHYVSTAATAAERLAAADPRAVRPRRTRLLSAVGEEGEGAAPLDTSSGGSPGGVESGDAAAEDADDTPFMFVDEDGNDDDEEEEGRRAQKASREAVVAATGGKGSRAHVPADAVHSGSVIGGQGTASHVRPTLTILPATASQLAGLVAAEDVQPVPLAAPRATALLCALALPATAAAAQVCTPFGAYRNRVSCALVCSL